MNTSSDKKTILLVEDNPEDVRLTRRSFRENHIVNELVVVGDGAEAMSYLQKQASDPDGVLPSVTLLDLNLPKLDGLEVLQRIRSDPRLKRLPIVILTSSKEEVDLVRSYELGANSYIQKPVEFEQFNDAVHNLGLYWLLLNEAPPKPAL
jgi:two-component system response regulator